MNTFASSFIEYMMRSIFSFLFVFGTLVVCGQNGSIPSAIQVPSGSKLLWHVYAKGVQVYVCTADASDSGRYVWTFREPRASLYADSGYHRLIGKHYLGGGSPTWEAVDGSTVSGVKVQQANAPDPAAIPWLLLQAKAGTGSGTLKTAGFIQRVSTSGGKAPATGEPRNKGQVLEVAYTAEYFFYSEK